MRKSKKKKKASKKIQLRRGGWEVFTAPRKPEGRLPRLHQLLNVEIKGAVPKRGASTTHEERQPIPANMATNPKA